MTGGIRKLIKVTGTMIAAMVGVGVPLGFGLEEYREAREHIAAQAERIAEDVSEYAYMVGPLWPYSDLRLDALLTLSISEEKDHDYRLTILSPSGEVIVQQDRDVAAPTIRRRAPIRIGEETVGWVEHEESQGPFVKQIGLLAMISGLFSIAALFAFRILPLHVLDRTLASLEVRNKQLQQREADLRRQYMISNAALSNMPIGLCMYSSDNRLVVSNKVFKDLFEVPDEALQPGQHFRRILESYAGANAPTNLIDEIVRRREELIAKGEHATFLQDLRGGRTIAISHVPMESGAWIATFEDITERKRVEAQVHKQNAVLREQEEQLRAQNVQLDAALNNMSQGLCMFDGERRLLICNKRYADLYSLPAKLTEAGTSLEEIIEHRVGTDNYKSDPKGYVDNRLAVVARGEHKIDVFEHVSGRVIEIEHHPLPGGGWVATHEDITERRHAEAQIAYLATHDALTDLPNRVLFREKLEHALVDAARGGSFAVHCLDLDRFKDVNDTLGHPVGDALLKQVAERLSQALCEDDAVARLGGDEFAIIQCRLERPEQASGLAERVIQIIGEPYGIDGHELVVATSVGVAIAPIDGLDPDQLLKSADMALYRAKADGRGTFRFFEKEMDARLQARRLFESELRTALGNGELEVYYQPVLNLETELISGFEALLRWHSPTRGMVSPVEFIPVAEETGLIIPFGEWALRHACAQAVTWPASLKVAVNLSAAQFKARNLVGTVMSALAASGLEPGRLELEVTESVLLMDSEATRATLHSLRGLGVRIALDDFGTGYSSLSYLRSFPFDKIKIDRSFVRDISTKRDCSAIVHAITDLARNLGMTTTAEGVETDEHLALLRSEGCTEIQGYLISPPRPAGDIPALLARYNGWRDKVPSASTRLAKAS